jgi:hypothetical protein
MSGLGLDWHFAKFCVACSLLRCFFRFPSIPMMSGSKGSYHTSTLLFQTLRFSPIAMACGSKYNGPKS